MSIKWKTTIATAVLGIFILSIFSVKSFGDTKHNNIHDISKKQLITWIEKQGKKDNYYYDGLSYELVDVDNDSELEVVVKIEGGVHLGNFFIFDRKQDGRYYLVTEQDWKVDSWNLYNPMTDPVDIENKEIFQTVTSDGGAGVDVKTIVLWYIEDGTFVKAWEGILKDRSTFQDDCFLKIGNYQFNNENNQIYAWVSSYKYQSDEVTLKERYGTNTMIYKFNGSHFVLDTETGYIK